MNHSQEHQPDHSGGAVSGFVLSIEQGTAMSTAILVDAVTTEIVAVGSHPVATHYPQHGWVEHDADDIWESVLRAIDGCLAKAPGVVPRAIALSTQRENAVVWHRRTGAPLGPVIAWQDARTTEFCTALAPSAGERIHHSTGLALDPLYSAPKMRWLLDHAREAGASIGDISLGTVDAWLLWNLTGQFVTEAGNASRTLLFDLQSLEWNAGLLEAFGIPLECLPRVQASNSGFGTTQVGSGRLPAGVPVVAVMADSHASLYFHGCTEPGTGKATYKAGCSVMTPCVSPVAIPDGITTTVAWVTDTVTYAREGNSVSSGAALEWLAAILGRAAVTPGDPFLSNLADTVDDSAGVVFVPAFSGLSAPYWDRHATSVIAGITSRTSRAHMARAALEAVAHQVADIVEAIEADGYSSIGQLKVDGDWTQSRVLMGLQADLVGRPISVANEEHASALGVALMAARTLGIDQTPPEHLAGVYSAPIEPKMTTEQRLSARRAWASGIQRARGLPVNRD